MASWYQGRLLKLVFAEQINGTIVVVFGVPAVFIVRHPTDFSTDSLHSGMRLILRFFWNASAGATILPPGAAPPCAGRI